MAQNNLFFSKVVFPSSPNTCHYGTLEMEGISEIFHYSFSSKAESNLLRPLVHSDSGLPFALLNCVKYVSAQTPILCLEYNVLGQQETCLTHLYVPESTWHGPWHKVGSK